MSQQPDGASYLRDFLRVAPLSHAAFRAVEALAVRRAPIEHPVLDVGCGFGEFAGVVFDQLEMGIDVNEADLDLGRQSDKYQRMLWSDARRMPFASGTFASVVSVSVLEHVYNVPMAFHEIHRVLQPGGTFVLTFPTTAMYRNLFFPAFLRALGLPGAAKGYIRMHRALFKHVTLHTKGWWLKNLEAEGFTIEQCYGTISPAVMRLHDFFLLTALPSQISKWLTGRRVVRSAGLRARFLPPVLRGLIKLDEQSEINLCVIARKR